MCVPGKLQDYQEEFMSVAKTLQDYDNIPHVRCWHAQKVNEPVNLSMSSVVWRNLTILSLVIARGKNLCHLTWCGRACSSQIHHGRFDVRCRQAVKLQLHLPFPPPTQKNGHGPDFFLGGLVVIENSGLSALTSENKIEPYHTMWSGLRLSNPTY